MTGRQRQRADTATAEVDAFRDAVREIKPPAHLALRPCDRAIWRSIIRSRAVDEWSDVDLLHAAQLARAFADIERLSRELAAEGYLLKTGRRNPKHAFVEVLTRRTVRLTKMLHLHAATLGPARDHLARRAAERTARAAVDAADDDADNLLATPSDSEQKH
jgi:hypothetical protein